MQVSFSHLVQKNEQSQNSSILLHSFQIYPYFPKQKSKVFSVYCVAMLEFREQKRMPL